MIGYTEGRIIIIYTDIVEKTKKLIKDELEQINCERVAEYNNYSMKQMNRIFLSQTDMSLGEYINDKRLAQAVMDLRYTNLPILQIAQKNGYSTQESFTRAVKKTFHVTPYQFRKDHVWSEDDMEEKLAEVIEETSHEAARQDRVELPEPHVRFVHKQKSLWYYIAMNKTDLFPHNFYVQCQKDHLYERLHYISNENPIGGAYLTHIYKNIKFAALTLGFETDDAESYKTNKELEVCIMPESDYLVVNVPPYRHYELGAHVLAAWNVFSEFDYSRYHLKRDLDHAPIYEWDSKVDGYTLYFPVTK
ncbi:helix-turn-helix transcriptional regulator [Anaerosporobacter faecicola]|uniref:helix-turn-helix transcriptional regulator n=1 Tax=Anaerosporobacter faecicola TaxID=2718714 RepID=UPI00143B4505|nr:AraC family transcriptional regulator [Anaerosporobacter faecicola]